MWAEFLTIYSVVIGLTFFVLAIYLYPRKQSKDRKEQEK